MNTKLRLKQLFVYVLPHKKRLIFASFMLIVGALMSLPQPLLSRYVIDEVIVGKNIEHLNPLILIIISLAIFEAVIVLLKRYHFIILEQEVIFDVQHDLFSRVLRFPKSFFDNRQTGYLMSRLTGDVQRLRIFFSSTFIELATNVLRFAGGIIILLYLNAKLAFIAFVTVPFFFYSAYSFGQKVKPISHKMMEKSALFSKSLQESIAGICLIKVFAREEYQLSKYDKAMRENVDASIEQNILNSYANFFIGIISSLGIILILWMGSREILHNNLTIGSFFAFNSYLGYLYGPSMFLANTLVRIQSSVAAIERVFELFDLLPEDENDISKEKLLTIQGEIDFSNVCFSYSNSNFALNEISFSAKPGEVIGIVGPTGAGKTTLMHLLLFLYKPSSGIIKIDGKNAENISIRSIRERISIVSQDLFLFDDTIYKNICFGNINVSEDEVYQACQFALAHEFIDKLPQGLQTHIGERGAKLSVGQKQRISIARALVKNPDVLIFDEPTSALDALTEKSIKENIFCKNGKTTFIIAHRLSTIAHADKIIVLDEGKILEVGTHFELINLNGIYSKLYNEQIHKNRVKIVL